LVNRLVVVGQPEICKRSLQFFSSPLLTSNSEIEKSVMPAPDFIVFGAPSIEQSEIDEVVHCLESGWIGAGPRVAQFENEFACYKGVASAAAVNSCTAAMRLSVLAAAKLSDAEVTRVVEAVHGTLNGSTEQNEAVAISTEAERKIA
jgi:hypothetical protein